MCDLCKKDCGLKCDKPAKDKRTPHKHAALIKAWADGADIQRKTSAGVWLECTPHWDLAGEYRIKPEPSDLEKYGVEVGDLWAPKNCYPRERYTRVVYAVKGSTPLNCHGDPSDIGHESVLIFRRGVVNKL